MRQTISTKSDALGTRAFASMKPRDRLDWHHGRPLFTPDRKSFAVAAFDGIAGGGGPAEGGCGIKKAAACPGWGLAVAAFDGIAGGGGPAEGGCGIKKAAACPGCGMVVTPGWGIIPGCGMVVTPG